MDRRTLLRCLAAAPLATLPWQGAIAAAPAPRRLLLVELNGGNDSLAMVTPYADPALRSLRGALHADADALVRLDERIALHPGLAPLAPAFADGQLAVVMGLGYPDSNRSHFKAIEVWDTADPRAGTQGWLARLGPAPADSPFAANAFVIGRNPQPVRGADVDPVVIATARNFIVNARRLDSVQAPSDNPALQHVLRLQADIERAAGGLTARRADPPGTFPRHALGRDMQEAARLLIGAPAAPIVKVAHTGYDTHVRQRPTHDRQMTQLGESLAALRASLMQAGVWQHTLVMTYSEFGRRAKANGNQGTDHGTAASHLVMGGAIDGGLYGEMPSLSQLINDDLRVTTDFRCLYNAVLADWFGRPDAQIDPQRYPRLTLA